MSFGAFAAVALADLVVHCVGNSLEVLNVGDFSVSSESLGETSTESWEFTEFAWAFKWVSSSEVSTCSTSWCCCWGLVFNGSLGELLSQWGGKGTGEEESKDCRVLNEFHFCLFVY